MPKPFNSWARSMKEDIARRLRENEEVRGYNGSTVLREREREMCSSQSRRPQWRE